MNKMLVFDMDGTIADFYNVENWLEKLNNKDESPYVEALPMYNMDTLVNILQLLKNRGWRIGVTSWLAKESCKEYDQKVRRAKIAWLEKYGFPADEIHIVKYGTTKADCTRKYGGFQILVDDNEKVRKGWKLGNTIDATQNIIEILLQILSKEVLTNA